MAVLLVTPSIMPIFPESELTTSAGASSTMQITDKFLCLWGIPILPMMCSAFSLSSSFILPAFFRSSIIMLITAILFSTSAATFAPPKQKKTRQKACLQQKITIALRLKRPENPILLERQGIRLSFCLRKNLRHGEFLRLKCQNGVYRNSPLQLNIY